MTAPEGIPRGPVTGGGDCRMLPIPLAKDFKSSEVPGGVGLLGPPFACPDSPKADGVLRCFVRYEEDRGSAAPSVGSECLRVALGDPCGGEEAADLEGGM